MTAATNSTLVTPSEDEFQDAILQMLGVFAWRAVHFRPLRTATGHWRTPIQGPGCGGWPDILAVRTVPDAGGRHRIVAAEIKSRAGRVKPQQREWLRLLAAANVECYIWQVGVDSLRSIEAVLR